MRKIILLIIIGLLLCQFGFAGTSLDPNNDNLDFNHNSFNLDGQYLSHNLNDEATSEQAEYSVNYAGYIIELESLSLLEKKKEFELQVQRNEESILNRIPVVNYVYRAVTLVEDEIPSRLDDYEQQLTLERESAKNDILSLISANDDQENNAITGRFTGSDSYVGELAIEREYGNILNGFYINRDDLPVTQLEELDGVKSVTPNWEVQALISDSVPLLQDGILAGQLDENGNDCTLTGELCLTGKGVTIAVIDTGIDYTHDDLGGSSNRQSFFSKIFDYEITTPNYWFVQLPSDFLSIDKELIVFVSDWKLNIYNTSSEDLISYSPYDYYQDNMMVVRVNLVGDDKDMLLYGVSHTDNYIDKIPSELYLYNIVTGENTFVTYIDYDSDVDFIELYENSIYFSTLNSSSPESKTDIHKFSLTHDTSEIIYSLTNCVHVTINPELVLGCSKWKEPEGYEFDLVNLRNGQNIDIVGELPKSSIRGPLLDVYDDIIIYNYGFEYGLWDKFVLYNYTSGSYTFFSEQGSTINSVENSEDDTEGSNIIVSKGWISYAKKEDNLIFFSPNPRSTMHVYDLTKDVVITLPDSYSETFDVSNKKMCIVKADYNIYCHNYNSSSDYEMPPAEFNSKVIGGYDFVNNDEDPFDDNGHGTHVAATAAGNGLLKGVAPEAQIVAYKVLGADGSGAWDGILAALDRAIVDEVDIVSLSLGGAGNPDDLISRKIDELVEYGIVAVIAAGNSGPSDQTIGSPGTARNAITVGSTTKSNYISYFSSRGPVFWTDDKGVEKVMVKPDILATGGTSSGRANCDPQSIRDDWICAAWPNNEYLAISGTSMATPHVSGAAALLLERHPDWTPDEVKASMKETATDLGYSSIEQGSGLINISRLVNLDNPSELPFDLFVYSENQLNNIYESFLLEGIFPADYDSLGVDWRKSGDTSWRNDNIRIVGTETIIAEFEPHGVILEGGTYEFRVQLERSGTTRTSSIMMSFDADLIDGFPFRTEDDISSLFPPIVADINSDGSDEVIFAGGYNTVRTNFFPLGSVHVLNQSGYVDGFPVYGSYANGDSYNVEPDFKGIVEQVGVVVDLNLDGNMEIIVPGSHYNDKTLGGIFAFNKSGELFWSFKSDEMSNFGPISSYDLDGDMHPEIVFSTWDFNEEISKLWVLDNTGNLIWSKSIPGLFIAYGGINSHSFGDFSGDGSSDITFTTVNPNSGTKNIFILANDGDVIYSHEFSSTLAGEAVVPVSYDVDGDGVTEILFLESTWDYPLAAGKMDVLSFNGTDFIISTLKSFDDFLPQEFILSEFDGNLESPELIITGVTTQKKACGCGYSRKVVVLSLDGNIILDKWVESCGISTPSAGDVTGDGFNEIVFSSSCWNSNSSVYVLNRFGDFTKQFSMNSFSNYFNPALVDLDNDNEYEIVIHDSDSFIYMWNIMEETEKVGNLGEMDWPMFGQNPQHTGCYDCDKDVSSEPKSVITNPSQNEITGKLSIRIFDAERESFVTLFNETRTTQPGESIGLRDIFNSLDYNCAQTGNYELLAKYATKEMRTTFSCE